MRDPNLIQFICFEIEYRLRIKRNRNNKKVWFAYPRMQSKELDDFLPAVSLSLKTFVPIVIRSPSSLTLQLTSVWTPTEVRRPAGWRGRWYSARRSSRTLWERLQAERIYKKPKWNYVNLWPYPQTASQALDRNESTKGAKMKSLFQKATLALPEV